MTPPQASIAAQAPAGRLLVCATPIGNLEDITLRVLRALREADVVACEDTRRTRGLLERHGISARLVSFHDRNERARAGELADRVARGEAVALVSDAGTPVVSDPGFELIRRCLVAGLAVEVLPGPSAVVTALVASGLPAARWRFVGFLPRGSAERRRLLAGTPETLVAYESPQRLSCTLEEPADRDPERPTAVCRELTKLHEEVLRGSAGELATHFSEHAARGEIVLVCGGAQPRPPDLEGALRALRELVQAGARPRRAATAVAGLTGLGVNQLYRALTASSERE
jgi:16S rRNA (cytidine1402-2'-O)-methyltransferase